MRSLLFLPLCCFAHLALKASGSLDLGKKNERTGVGVCVQELASTIRRVEETTKRFAQNNPAKSHSRFSVAILLSSFFCRRLVSTHPHRFGREMRRRGRQPGPQKIRGNGSNHPPFDKDNSRLAAPPHFVLLPLLLLMLLLLLPSRVQSLQKVSSL